MDNKIISSNDWENRWASYYKVCYYPFFLYSLPFYDEKNKDDLDVIEQLHFHINNFKYYLLYFDFVVIPLGNLIRPINIFSNLLFKKVLEDKCTIDLIENKLLISTTHKNQNIDETFLSRIEYLKEIKWDIKSDIYKSTLRYEMSNLLLYERNVSQEIDVLLNLLNKRINNFTDEDIKNKMLRIVDIARKNNRLSFSHEVFTKKILEERKKKKEVYDFLLKANTDYYTMCELGNYGTILPFVGTNDNLIRQSENTGVFSYLYSIDFFKIFISLFIEDKYLIKIPLLNVSDIKLLRSYSFWFPTLELYHQLLTEISNVLKNIEKDNFEKYIREHLNSKFINTRYGYLFDIVLIIPLLLSKPLKLIRDHNHIKNYLDYQKNLTTIRIGFPDLYAYITELKKMLKNK